MAILSNHKAHSTINIKCTLAALEHIRKNLPTDSMQKLRIRLKKTGCSGWSYHFEYADSLSEQDILCNTQEGLDILLPEKYLSLFNGVIIDYVRSGFNGSLTCLNPNEGARCGCGESFTINN